MNLRHNIRAFGAFADSGGKRPFNEDCYFTFPEKLLFGIADGYGGAGIGEEAAKLSLEKAAYFIQAGLGDSEVTLPFVYRDYYTDSGNLVFNGVLYANEQILNLNHSRGMNERGGCNLLMAFAAEGKLILANVGTCQAVLVRRSRVLPLFKPRSYNHMRGVFQGSWNDKWGFPLAGLGHSTHLEPEIFELQLEKNDVIILSSDGIYPRLSEEDYLDSLKLLKSAKSLDLGISEQNRRLAEIAQQKGNTDNQSIISMICE